MLKFDRRTWLCLGAMAAAIIAAQDFVTRLVAPGPDFKVSLTRTAHSDGTYVSIASDAGNLTGWLQLTVTSSAKRVGTSYAGLSSGTPLVTIERAPAADGSWNLDIGSAAKVNEITVQPFEWRAGTAITILVAADAAVITDWVIHTGNRGSDSRVKMMRRTVWNYVLGAVIVLSAIGAVVIARGEPPQPPSAVRCVQEIIAAMSAEPAVKVLLTKVLVERAGVNEALESQKKTVLEQRILFFKARGLFRDRLHHLLADLTTYSQLLR